VDRFNSIFGGSDGWFCIDDDSRKFMADLRIKDNDRYFLNPPSTSDDERMNDETKNIESRLENKILYQQDNLDALKECCPAKLHRQLPVGLFHTEVNKDNAIFPSKHSAIDLWGVNGDDLYVLELKANGNCKVGVLSELFFYTMVLRDERTGRFSRKKKPGDEKSIEGKLISDTKQIKAFILAPELHPFISPEVFSPKVFDLLNEKLKNLNIKFGYIEFKYETEPEIKFNSFRKVH
jgi:hypothetical protein